MALNNQQRPRVLTGIKPTGTPHIGNYLGAIRPALQRALSGDFDSYFFIADYHALTGLFDAKLFNDYTYEVAATWLAFGLDPKVVTFYRQSDIPELFELNWILTCATSKGLTNRAHAYKSAVDANKEKGEDEDANINMGLYCYPILMSADILLFETDVVPVGQDQIQHIEMARDIAQVFNSRYRGDFIKLPKAQISEDTGVIPGLDGRKMSKSYQNTIPLFEDSKKLKKLVGKITTDSTPPAAPKDPASSVIFKMYREFATLAQQEALRDRYQKGISWGEAKMELFEVLDQFLMGPRQKYQQLMKDRSYIDSILRDGAQRARVPAQQLLEKVRRACGKQV